MLLRCQCRARVSRKVDQVLIPSTQAVAPILEIVRKTIGIDFSQYRPAMVHRRIRNRMITVGARTLDEYVSHIRTSDNEVDLLAERLTIKVSRFYRNAPMFDAVRHDTLPRLMLERGNAPLNIWVAGCACGEELYTLAMLLEERQCQGTIDGTDIDGFALRAAARGVYPSAALSELPADLRRRFLVPVDERGATVYKVADTLRARVRLHRHDITSPVRAPFRGGAVSIVSCRNVLIYLQKEAQARALARLRAALSPGGILVLGEAEWPPSIVLASLEVIAQKARIFRAV